MSEDHRTLYEIRLDGILEDLSAHAERVEKLKGFSEFPATIQNLVTYTKKAVEVIRVQTKEYFTPKPPLTWEDVESWVKSKQQGTYLTLIGEDGAIRKTLIVDRKKLYTNLHVEYLSEDVQIQMKKTLARITLPDGETLDKPIPAHITDARLYTAQKGEVKQGKLT